jgi:hypothetical protein
MKWSSNGYLYQNAHSINRHEDFWISKSFII